MKSSVVSVEVSVEVSVKVSVEVSVDEVNVKRRPNYSSRSNIIYSASRFKEHYKNEVDEKGVTFSNLVSV